MPCQRLTIRVFATATVACLLLGAPCFATATNEIPAKPDGPEQAYTHISMLTHVMEIVRQDYVDRSKTGYESLVTGALEGMMRSLDPYSQFMEPPDYDDMKDETAGQYGGIGIKIGLRDGILTIIAPIEDTPGFRAGLLPGDRIIEINGSSTAGITLQGAVKKLRGESDTAVTITIQRRTEEIKEVTITRAMIKINSVKNVRILRDTIGYVRITQFNRPTGAMLLEAIEKLQKQDMAALVLDLRNNPGGLLDSAVEVSSLFLKRGATIVSTKGRRRSQSRKYTVRGRRAHFVGFPIAVLANEGSASASEIVAGALRDNKRAIIVGEATYGKGSVQTVLPLNDGFAVRLTTAKYCTPSGDVIDDDGILPDIIVELPAAEWREIVVTRETPLDDEAFIAHDTQLRRALDILKGVSIFQKRKKRMTTAAK